MNRILPLLAALACLLAAPSAFASDGRVIEPGTSRFFDNQYEFDLQEGVLQVLSSRPLER
jgi:succinylglutamate desuccinylase